MRRICGYRQTFSKLLVNVHAVYAVWATKKKNNHEMLHLQGVSHNSADAKTEAEFTWTPGADTAGPITFRSA